MFYAGHYFTIIFTIKFPNSNTETIIINRPNMIQTIRFI